MLTDGVKAKITIMFMLVAFLVSCHNKKNGPMNNVSMPVEVMDTCCDTVAYDEYDKIIHAHMAYYDFDKIGNLTSFFDAIAQKHPVQIWLPEEDSLESKLRQCVADIDSYRNGNRQFFPDSLVSNCLRSLGFNAAIVSDHGPEYTDLVYGEWFMMCAAYYSPDITYLVDMQSTDHSVGALNYGKGYNTSPWWAYAIVKRKKGYEAMCLGDQVVVRSLFQIEDSSHRRYYLFSNNLTELEFFQALFFAPVENEAVKVDECTEPSAYESVSVYDTFYFDQKSLIWKFCKTDNKTGKLQPTYSRPALKLSLDGIRSRFVKKD